MVRAMSLADDVSMSENGEASGVAVFDAAALRRLVEVLIERGYRVIGPTLRDNAIVLAELESAADLPRGWGVDVGPGHYRVRRRDDDAAFGHSAGPQSWKQFLHPPGSGRGPERGTGSAPWKGEPNPTPRPRGTRSLECAVATWPRSRRWIGCSAVPNIRTTRTSNAGGAFS
jgi:hypothetical protein